MEFQHSMGFWQNLPELMGEGKVLSLQCPPNSCWNPEESSGMKFGRMACYFLHSSVISFWWNLGIPELRPECSMEFTGMECNGTESGCLVNTLFGFIVCLLHTC